MVERLKHVHKLYEDLGTLAAGRVIGVTRERVRQLLVKGSHLGLFEYKPFEYPFVAKETPNCRLPKTFEFGAFGQGEWDYLWISWQVAKWNTLQFRLCDFGWTFCSYRKREISDGQCSSRHLRVANQSGRLFHDP